MRFSELLDAVRSHPRELSIPASWAQGRASFGGLVAALQYEAMRARVPAAVSYTHLTLPTNREV